MSRSDAAVVAGVDGCPAGWVAVIGSSPADAWLIVARTFGELVDRQPRVRAWAVDIPVGLADDGPRPCDAAARKRLGRERSSSVFPAPPRCVVEATDVDYAEACRLAAAATGKKIPKQAWNLTPKIRDVRAVLIDRRALRRRVFETHPELCFARMQSGEALAEGKKTAEGRSRRESLLTEVFGRATVKRFVAQTDATRGVGVDDALDAMACWTAAQLFAAGDTESAPDNPATDATGLPVAIRW